MGCIGMSLRDFERCTPAEFYAVWNRWQKREELAQRDGWERTRMLALFMVQPWSENRLTARDILRFPWDEAPTEEHKEQEENTDVAARFEAARKRYGLK